MFPPPVGVFLSYLNAPNSHIRKNPKVGQQKITYKINAISAKLDSIYPARASLTST